MVRMMKPNGYKTSSSRTHENKTLDIRKDVLQENARKEFDASVDLVDSEEIQRRLILGWHSVEEIQHKLVDKVESIQKNNSTTVDSGKST